MHILYKFLHICVSNSIRQIPSRSFWRREREGGRETDCHQRSIPSTGGRWYYSTLYPLYPPPRHRVGEREGDSLPRGMDHHTSGSPPPSRAATKEHRGRQCIQYTSIHFISLEADIPILVWITTAAETENSPIYDRPQTPTTTGWRRRAPSHTSHTTRS